MKDKILAFFKRLFLRPEPPVRIQFLALHMQQTTHSGWLTRMASNKRLSDYLWEPPRNP
jgi:hypothetical protein